MVRKMHPTLVLGRAPAPFHPSIKGPLFIPSPPLEERVGVRGNLICFPFQLITIDQKMTDFEDGLKVGRVPEEPGGCSL